MMDNTTSLTTAALKKLAKLEKLAKARITATSPRGRVKVTAVGTSYHVELRREGFQSLDPDDLATEVTHAFTGAMRAYKHAERQVFTQDRSDSPTPKLPEQGRRRREFASTAIEAISVSATSTRKLVAGTWKGANDITLRIAAVNESHRTLLADEIAVMLTELAREYGVALRQCFRDAAAATPAEV